MNLTTDVCFILMLICFPLSVDAYPSIRCRSQGRNGKPQISRYRLKEYLYFTNEKLDLFSAYCRCLGWGAQLLTIRDNSEQQHINQNMPKLPSDCNAPPNKAFFYMGLYLYQGVWTWPDNTTLGSFRNWKQKKGRCNIEPNGYQNCFTKEEDNFQNSTQIFACNTDHGERGKWFDKHESQSRWYYICERPYTPPPTKPPKIVAESTTSRSKTKPIVRTTTVNNNVVTGLPATSKKNTEYLSTAIATTAITTGIRTDVVTSTAKFTATQDYTKNSITPAGTSTSTDTLINVYSSTTLNANTVESTVNTTDAAYFDNSTNSSAKIPKTSDNIADTEAPGTNIATKTIVSFAASTTNAPDNIVYTEVTGTDIATKTIVSLAASTTNTPDNIVDTEVPGTKNATKTIVFLAASTNNTLDNAAITFSTATATGSIANSNNTNILTTTTDTAPSTSFTITTTTDSRFNFDTQDIGKASPNFSDKKLETLYGQLNSSFNITNWEDNLSSTLSEWFLQQNASSHIVSLPNAKICLFKFNSKSELLDEFSNKSEGGSNDSIEIKLDKNNRVFLNISQFQNSTFPIVIVAAGIHQNLWKYSLTNFSFADTDGYTLNKKLKVLPQGGSILSVSVYKVNDDNTTNKISVDVWPVFDLENDSTLCDIERSNEGRSSFEDIRYQCGFFKTGKIETWSQKGCELRKIEGRQFFCHCNHTTAFGIILAFREIRVPPIVSTVVTVLQSITIVALALTVMCLLIVRKKLRNSRTIVQINLATSLLFLHFFFVLGGPALTLNAIFCEACAVLTHYFTLSSAFWMLNEGLVLYFKTCKTVLSLDVKKLLPTLIAVAWGVPFLLVLVCVSVGFTNGIYMDVNKHSCKSNSSNPYHSCWIGVEHNMIYTVIVPLSVIFFVTGCIIIRTTVEISKMSRKVTKMRSHGSAQAMPPEKKKTRFATTTSHSSVALRAVALLLPVLGVPWVIGFLVNIKGSEEIMQILNGIINGLQGVFIFFIYCIKNSQFRRAFCRKLSNYTNQELPTNSKLSRVLSFSSTHPKTKIRI